MSDKNSWMKKSLMGSTTLPMGLRSLLQAGHTHGHAHKADGSCCGHNHHYDHAHGDHDHDEDSTTPKDCC